MKFRMNVTFNCDKTDMWFYQSNWLCKQFPSLLGFYHVPNVTQLCHICHVNGLV
jgi:hypothetical protein